MSKTTNKLGQPIFHATIKTEAKASPSPALLAQWEMLDFESVQKYGKTYDSLNTKNKLDLHFELKLKAEKLRKEKKQK